MISTSYHKNRKRPSSTSTWSVTSHDSSVADVVDKGSDDSVLPAKLKRSPSFIASKQTSSDVTFEDFSNKFVFPISKEVQKCNDRGHELPEKARNKFLRECFTCLQAIAGDRDNITSNEYELAAKKICKSLPIFKDRKPNGWPITKLFPYWVSWKN